ncbi:MAG: hypothetical protein JXR10_17595 [Cyclobacteriaceae bacterium]
MDTTDKLLHEPISSLNMSSEFQAMAKANDFNTLYEMMEFKIEELQKIKGFNYRMVAEYVTYFEKNGLDLAD